MMSASEISQCFSKQMFPIHQRIKVSLRNLNPAIHIADVKVLNDSMISFELDSTRSSAGLKIIVVQAGSQVCLLSLQTSQVMPISLQVFNQQICINVTMNEHLTQEKLIEIMIMHKDNPRIPFIDENIQLNQRQMLSDIDFVISSSASCTSTGI